MCDETLGTLEKLQLKLVSLKSHRTFNETCLYIHIYNKSAEDYHVLESQLIYICITVLCDELFHKFIHRRERSKFASSRYPLLYLWNEAFWRYGEWNIKCLFWAFDPISRYMKWAGPTQLDPTSKNKFFLMVFPFIWVLKWIFLKKWNMNLILLSESFPMLFTDS